LPPLPALACRMTRSTNVGIESSRHQSRAYSWR
jgi:hypothetical protein